MSSCATESDRSNPASRPTTSRPLPFIQTSKIPKNPPIVRFSHLLIKNAEISPSSIKLRVYFAGPLSVLVKQVFYDAGFMSSRENCERFNVCWGAPKTLDFYQTLATGQIINQWPGSVALGNKGAMARCGNAAFKRNSKFDVWLRTFILPADSTSLKREMDSFPLKWYIYKPVNANRGEGIKLVRSGDKFDWTKDVVVQQYLKAPLIVNKRKFDLRIYVLITSIDPLIVYVFDQGLARFASNDYEKPSKANKRQNSVHLTNYSINKHQESAFPTKISLAEILETLSKNPEIFTPPSNFTTEQLTAEIHRAVILGVIAAEPRLFASAHTAQCAHAFPRKCFGIYGFDVIFDAAGRPKLLEMNISPSTEASSELDIGVKLPLLADALDLIGINAPSKIPTFGAGPKGFSLESGERKLSGQGSGTGRLDGSELTRFEKRVLWQIRDEGERLGGFTRLLPDLQYRELFEQERYLNSLCERFLEFGVKGEF